MGNWLKFAGIATSLIGAGVSFIADQIDEQKMKETVKEEVKREIAEQLKDEES